MKIRYRHTRVVGGVEVIEDFEISCDNKLDILQTLYDIRGIVEQEPMVDVVPIIGGDDE